MISLQEYSPNVYYRQSRDYQMLGRLFDVALNSAKTNADMIYDIPKSDAAGSKLIDLLVLTLGFKPKHGYNIEQLSAVCSILPTIIRNKGSLMSIEMACQALLTSEGINESAHIELHDDYTLEIYISPKISDLSLLLDMLDYILPAGMSCTINKCSTAESRPMGTEVEDKHSIWHAAEVLGGNNAVLDSAVHMPSGFDLYSDSDSDPDDYRTDKGISSVISNSLVIAKDLD